MGEASVADCADASSIYWNPAALDILTKNQVNLSYQSYYGDAHYDNISYVSPAGKYGAFGAGVSYIGYGSYEEVDSSGNVLGNQTAGDMLMNLAYGRDMFLGIRGGIAVKELVTTMGADSANGFDMDAALFKPFGEFVDTGIIARNVLPLSVKYSDGGTDNFTTSVRGGIGLKFLDGALKIR